MRLRFPRPSDPSPRTPHRPGRWPLLAAALALAVAGSGPAAAQTVYVVGTDNSFGFFDLGTYQYNQIAASLGTTTYNLTTNGASGFYATQNTGVGNDTFVTVSAAGAVTQIGAANATGDIIIGLASSGTVYGYGSNGVGTIGTVSTSTGVYTATGTGAGANAGGNLGGGALAFEGGTLYLTATDNGGSLYPVNTGTGAVGTAITSGNILYSTMILFGTGSGLYGITDTTVYSVDTGTGTLGMGVPLTGLGTVTSFTGAAVGPAPVPEPGTVLGVAAAGLGLAGWVRRRRAVRTAG